MLYFTVSRRKENLKDIRELISQETRQAGFSENTAYLCLSAVDEMLANIFDHGLTETEESKVNIAVIFYGEEVAVSFRYRGRPFQPDQAKCEKIDLPKVIAEKHGLGLKIILTTMDRVDFHYENGENTITLYKKREAAADPTDDPSILNRLLQSPPEMVLVTPPPATDPAAGNSAAAERYLAALPLETAAAKRLLAHYLKVQEWLSTERPEEELLDAILQEISHCFGCGMAALLIADAKNKNFIIQSARCIPDEVGTRLSFRHTVSGWTYLHQQLITVPAIEEDERYLAVREERYYRGVFLSTPLTLAGQSLGVLNLCAARERPPFSDAELDSLTLWLKPLLLALRHYQNSREKQRSILDVIGVLIGALDAKDAYTAGHSERVMQYSMLIANRIGLCLEEKEAIQYASLLHDIGKIGIKESILNKGGTLSTYESLLMKNHPVIGMNILRSVGALAKVGDLIKHHHEHWDGSGYPEGRRGEQIPIGSRIIMIADSFEAMTSDRPYHKAMDKHKAVLEVQKGAGRQFDPRLVTIFMEVLDEILQRDLLVQKTELKKAF